MKSADLSWIDHPANLRANAVLLRAVADQSLLHADEIERLRAVIIRAKDALLDGQSTQWVHDLLVAAILGPKP